MVIDTNRIDVVQQLLKVALALPPTCSASHRATGDPIVNISITVETHRNNRHESKENIRIVGVDSPISIAVLMHMLDAPQIDIQKNEQIRGVQLMFAKPCVFQSLLPCVNRHCHL